MSKKSILVCDDDEGILEMIEMILESYDYNVIPEANSLNIFKVIDKNRPDLVLLDLWMPMMSGDQVLKTLRANPNTINLPVIIISASRDGDKIAIQSGANDFIAKPFDVQNLLNVISEYVH